MPWRGGQKTPPKRRWLFIHLHGVIFEKICILTVCLCLTTLTEVSPCFSLSCKANARVKLAKTGHGQHSSKLTFFIITNLIHKFLVHSHKWYKIKFLYMFRAQSAHHQEVNDVNCTYAASGIVTLCKRPCCATAKEGLVGWEGLLIRCQIGCDVRSYVTVRGELAG